METKEWSWVEFKPLFTKTEVFSHFSKIPPLTFISWRVWAPSSQIPRKQTAGLHSRLAGQLPIYPQKAVHMGLQHGNYLACVLLCLLLATHLSFGQVCEHFIGNMLEDENHKSPHNIFHQLIGFDHKSTVQDHGENIFSKTLDVIVIGSMLGIWTGFTTRVYGESLPSTVHRFSRFFFGSFEGLWNSV